MAGLGSIIQAGTGITQTIMGGIGMLSAKNKMNDLLDNRPQYQTPQEIKDMLALYQKGVNENMPGYDIAKANLSEQTAMGAQTAKEMGGGIGSIGAVADLYNSERKSMNELALTAAQYKRQAETMNMQNLGNALKTKADYTEREWYMNDYAPWSMKYNTAQNMMNYGGSMVSSGQSNLQGGMAGMTAGMDTNNMGATNPFG